MMSRRPDKKREMMTSAMIAYLKARGWTVRECWWTPPRANEYLSTLTPRNICQAVECQMRTEDR